MEYLREFAQRGDVRRIVEAALQQPSVQGVGVDLDPFWLLGWRMRMSSTAREFNAWDARVTEAPPLSLRRPGWGAIHPLDRAWWMPEGGELDPGPPDTSFTFQAWERLAKRRGTSAEPFVVKVIRRPGMPEVEPAELYIELPPTSLRVVFETRALAHAYARRTDCVRPLVGGLSGGTPGGGPGTLGGVLEAADGTRYALTCSHVVSGASAAEQPSSRDNAGAAALVGACVASTTLQPPSSACNPYAATGDRVDVALIELHASVTSALEVRGIGTLAGRAAIGALNPGVVVETSGKRTGHRRLRVGGLMIAHLIHVDGQPHCFNDLFELRSPSHLWPIAGMLRPPVRHGDSGAWVIAQGAGGAEWCGVVIGGDGAVGYATFTAFVEQWLAAEGFGGLTV
jgi:hypothetical protein